MLEALFLSKIYKKKLKSKTIIKGISVGTIKTGKKNLMRYKEKYLN